MLDTSTIAAAGADIRSLVKEAHVGAPPMKVWEAWTSSDGIAAWWGPPASNIDLRIGGPFELFFAHDAPEGSRGSEGCKVLAYVPGESLSFTWNAPPHLALRETNTWVVLTFTSAAAGTTVRLVHTGFLTGADWDEYMAYFDEAWEQVLELLVTHWS